MTGSEKGKQRLYQGGRNGHYGPLPTVGEVRVLVTVVLLEAEQMAEAFHDTKNHDELSRPGGNIQKSSKGAPLKEERNQTLTMKGGNEARGQGHSMVVTGAEGEAVVR